MIIVEHQVSKLILQSLFGGLVGLLLQWKHEILAVTVSGADRVLEETMTHHTLCSKSSCHWPFIYSFISVDKSANDAEHHLWADTLQPGTAVKVSTFFFFFVYLMLTWERDLFFYRDSIRLTQILLAWLEREQLAMLTSTPISHSRYSDATKLRSEKAQRATKGNRFWLSLQDSLFPKIDPITATHLI